MKYYNLFTWLFCKVFMRLWLEYHTSSILLCSHGVYCLNRVYTQKTFNLSRLALSRGAVLLQFFFNLFYTFLNTLQLRLTQYLDITRYFYCCNKCSCQFLRIYFRDMSHLRESLNDLLGSNFIASYKKGRRE